MTGAAEIYIEGSPAERRAGHLDANGLALGLDIERVTRPRLIGAIYLARVKAVDKRLGAAFLDLGAAGIGLLSKAKDVIEGEAVLVQISRDAHDDKGPAALRQIVLWGRYLGLQPGRGGGLQCARALGQGKRRAEALAAAESGIADPTDLILRGPSWTVSGSELKAEADRLRATWADIQAKAKTEKAPALLLPTTPFIETMLRDAGPEARVALDDRLDFATAEKLCAQYFPDLLGGLAFHNDPAPIFDASGFSDILEQALGSEVTLTGGGRLTIEQTKALTSIDVDMGAGEAGASTKDEAIHRLNRRASEEIARQIILRRLSGLIVIDFAGLTGRGKMKTFLDILRSRLKNADTHSDVLGISPAGLVEITRQRMGPSLADLCLAPVAFPPAAPDALAAEVLRRALRLQGAGKPVVSLPDSAAAVLNDSMKAAREACEKRLGQPLILKPGAARLDVRLERDPA